MDDHSTISQPPVWSPACVARFAAGCPSRELFDQIVDKWSMMVLCVLDAGPQRFNALRRILEGVSQKSLSQTLRRLERNGLILRHVRASAPVAVEYEMSELGRSLVMPLRNLHVWTKQNLSGVDAARAAYDAMQDGA